MLVFFRVIFDFAQKALNRIGNLQVFLHKEILEQILDP